MKTSKSLIFIIVVITVSINIGCHTKTDNHKSTIQDSTKAVTNDSLLVDSQESISLNLTLGETTTRAYIDSTSGDTIYVDFTFEYEDPKLNETKHVKYFIISPSPVLTLNKDYVDELNRWKTLEDSVFLDKFEYGKDQQFYIAIRKRQTKKEAIKEWKTLIKKYPKANLNFYHMSKKVPVE